MVFFEEVEEVQKLAREKLRFFISEGVLFILAQLMIVIASVKPS